MSSGSSRWMTLMSLAIELGRVVREADDVAAIADAAHLSPREQHVAVVRDVVLLLVRAVEAVGIDVLEADEHALDPGRSGLFDEARNLVAHRVDLDHEAGVQALLAQRDQPVEDRLPVPVAREIVVGDEEVAHAVGVVGAHDPLDVVGGPVARLAPLDVDDRAEGAEERTAPARVEARDHAERPADLFARQVGGCRSVEARQVVEEIVDRLQRSRGGVGEHVGEAPLRLPGEQGDSEVERLFQRIRRLGQHGEATRDVEAADADRNARRAQGTRDVHDARKLVRLHADETDEPPSARLGDLVGDAVGPDAGIGLVNGKDLDVHVGERPGFDGGVRDAVKAGERVGRQGRPEPLDDVAVVVVVRRLDQKEQEPAAVGGVRHGVVSSKDGSSGLVIVGRRKLLKRPPALAGRAIGYNRGKSGSDSFGAEGANPVAPAFCRRGFGPVRNLR